MATPISISALTVIEPLMLLVDGFPNRRHNRTVNTSTVRVETGAVITDHAVALPEMLNLTGIVSDFDGAQRVADAYQAIRGLVDPPTLVRVVTEWHIYVEALITSFNATTAGRGMEFQMSLQEIQRAASPIVLPPRPPPPPPRPPPPPSGSLNHRAVDLNHPGLHEVYTQILQDNLARRIERAYEPVPFNLNLLPSGLRRRGPPAPGFDLQRETAQEFYDRVNVLTPLVVEARERLAALTPDERDATGIPYSVGDLRYMGERTTPLNTTSEMLLTGRNPEVARGLVNTLRVTRQPR